MTSGPYPFGAQAAQGVGPYDGYTEVSPSAPLPGAYLAPGQAYAPPAMNWAPPSAPAPPPPPPPPVQPAPPAIGTIAYYHVPDVSGATDGRWQVMVVVGHDGGKARCHVLCFADETAAVQPLDLVAAQ